MDSNLIPGIVGDLKTDNYPVIAAYLAKVTAGIHLNDDRSLPPGGIGTSQTITIPSGVQLRGCFYFSYYWLFIAAGMIAVKRPKEPELLVRTEKVWPSNFATMGS